LHDADSIAAHRARRSGIDRHAAPTGARHDHHPTEVATPMVRPSDHSTTQSLAAPLTRRRFAALLPLALAAGLAVTGGIASSVTDASAAPSAAVAAQAASLRTTVDLNLRAGPGTNYKVLLVIPKGAHVFDNGEVSNGFRRITYANTVGWSAAQYLTAGTPVPPHPGPIVGARVATIDLNLRAGPSTGDKVIRVIPRNAPVQITDTVVDGYRYVYYQDLGGWAFDQYLGEVPGDGPDDPAYATTTADVNLRAGPTASTRVLAVIPEGSRVKLEAGAAGDYRQVTYQGTRGWVAYAYLN
jgi:uncharacterized protein YraI